MIAGTGQQPGRAAGVLSCGLVAAFLLLAGCQHSGHEPSAGPAPGPTAVRTSAAASAGAAAPTRIAGPSATAPVSAESTPPAESTLPAEPTTTNTLPPPPEPTAPAPKTSGPLTARDLPVPAGWRPVVREGGAEEGYQGNGSWVHGRDPRYAARDVITVGCAPITRDDYPDPVAALEGTYGQRGATATRPGVGLLLQFGSPAEAGAYFTRYVAQVRACTDPDAQTYTTVLTSRDGLIDRRTYDGSTDWTEVAAVTGDRATFIILTDPGHRITRSAADSLLNRLRR